MTELNELHPDFAGLPVELMTKLDKEGDVPGALCLQDLAQLRTFIIGQRDVINAQQRRIAELLEDNELRRQGSKLQVEQLEKYLATLELERDALAAQVREAGL